jgi:ech hydrogenase subunit D
MKLEEQPLEAIDLPKLIGKVAFYRDQGYRLVQVSCTKVEEGFEITYTFDRDDMLQNVRVVVPQDAEVPSISGIYWGAFVYENEMHDLFGVDVRGMNINFKGNFIRTATKNPFTVVTFKGGGPCQEK